MNDEEAVRRCQDGDREAFRHLVDRYKDLLYGTACLMTGNTSIAEEHVQKALISAWRGMSSFRIGRPLKPWLVRILVNTVMGHLGLTFSQFVLLRLQGAPKASYQDGLKSG